MKLRKPVISIRPVALADILFTKDKRAERFLSLGVDEQVEMFGSLTKHVKHDVLARISDPDLAKLVETIEPDDATDLLQLLTPHRREKVLLLLSKHMKESLSTLLEFDAETAAGLMTLDYIQTEDNKNIAYVANKFKHHEKETGRPPVILVTKEQKLIGFLPGYQLGLAAKSELVGKYVKRLPSISYAATHDEVVRLFSAHPNGKVAVLNDAGIVIGIIYSDDVLQLIKEQPDSSLYNFAGISSEESVTDSAGLKFHNRYRWLIINLATGFLAAYTISVFEATLEQFVLLAIYMPIVAGMGGNAATQTLAVQVRGISLGQIELKTAWKTLRSEIGASLLHGLLSGLLVGLIVIIINRDVKIALILAVAMVFNLLVAGFFGTLVPLIMSKLGKDPAASATIFITTATDVLGFLGFLGLATLVL